MTEEHEEVSITDGRAEAWGEEDLAEPEEVIDSEEVVEEAEAVEPEEVVEEVIVPDPLQDRVAVLEAARVEREAERVREEDREANSKKLKLDETTLSGLKDRFDLSGVTFPHPVEDGQTMTYDEVKAEYPGISEFAETMVSMVAKDSDAKLEALTERIEQMQVRGDVLRSHPDADAVYDDPKFTTWLKGQNESVNLLLNYGNGTDISLVLSDYKKTIVPKVVPKAKPGMRAPAKKAQVVKPGAAKATPLFGEAARRAAYKEMEANG